METKGLRNYLLMCTGTHLQVGIKHDGVAAPVAQGGIGHRALKIHEKYQGVKEFHMLARIGCL